MLVTKMILKMLIVKIRSSVLTNGVRNKADINKVMDKNPCKIHQESQGESKSIKVSYSGEDFSSLLRDISRQNMNRIKIGHLNINSIRNKFDMLIPAVVRNLDILLITETKINNSLYYLSKTQNLGVIIKT